MSVSHRLRIIQAMESIVARVQNSSWLSRAKDFINDLKDRLFHIDDAELFSWLKDWEEKFLPEITNELYC